MVGVYKITNPIGQVYVGSSKDIDKRWRSHKTTSRRHHRKLVLSFDKYGKENHKFEIIIECKEDELKELETFYGLQLGALDTVKGLNLILPKLKDGSGGCSKDKISWNRGKKGLQTPWNKGKKGLQEPWNKGIPVSEETKNKIRLKKLGTTSPRKGVKTGLPAWNSKVVLDLQTGIFYKSISEAGEAIEIERRKLVRMINRNDDICKRIKIFN